MWFKPASSGGGGGSVWNDRGDTLAADFAVGDFTLGGAGTLDLSAIVGANAVLVLLRAFINPTLGGNDMSMFTNGGTPGNNVCKFKSQGSEASAEHDFWVYTDAAGVVGYNMYIPNATSLNMTVRGWFSAA